MFGLNPDIYRNHNPNQEMKNDKRSASRTVVVRPKFSYGQWLFVPINDTAHLFAELLGSKTLSARALKVVRKLDYEIIREQMDINALLDDLPDDESGSKPSE
jgi:hypothetical protein